MRSQNRLKLIRTNIFKNLQRYRKDPTSLESRAKNGRLQKMTNIEHKKWFKNISKTRNHIQLTFGVDRII